jgi:hypothetical protein
MFNKRRNELSNGAGSSDILEKRRKASDRALATIVRNNTIDEGISAFTLWLGGNGKDSARLPITMKQFKLGINKIVVSMQDNILKKDILVGIVDGIPFCDECKSNDCAHVGFAVCAEQMNIPSRLE